MRWLDDTTDSKDFNLSKTWEIAKGREAWCAVVHGHTKRQDNLVTEQQQKGQKKFPLPSCDTCVQGIGGYVSITRAEMRSRRWSLHYSWEWS